METSFCPRVTLPSTTFWTNSPSPRWWHFSQEEGRKERCVFTSCIYPHISSCQYQSRAAARIRAELRSKVVTYNLPLEISLYLVRARCGIRALSITYQQPQSSYIAALQERNVVAPPTASKHRLSFTACGHRRRYYVQRTYSMH